MVLIKSVETTLMLGSKQGEVGIDPEVLSGERNEEIYTSFIMLSHKYGQVAK